MPPKKKSRILEKLKKKQKKLKLKRKLEESEQIPQEDESDDKSSQDTAQKKGKKAKKTSKQEFNERRQEIRAKVGRLAAEEFQVVKRMELKPSELSQQQEGASLASAPNLSLVGSTLDIVKIFFIMLPLVLWEHLAEMTSRRILSKKATGEYSGQYASRYAKEVSPEEITWVFALMYFFRGRRNNVNFDEQFKDKDLEGGCTIPITQKRFTIITANLCCDWPVFLQILRDAWFKAWIPGEYLAVDEAMWKYHCANVDPSNPNPPPTRYIPRKPHPNGMLCYILAGKTPFGPFAFDIQEDICEYKLNPRCALLSFQSRWKGAHKPHIVVDSGFSGDDVILASADNGFKITGSFNKAHKLWLFQLLKLCVRSGRWVAVKDKDGRIWSVKQSGSDYHFLCTNGFQDAENHTPEASFPFDQEDLKALSKLSRRALLRISNVMQADLTRSLEPVTIARAILEKCGHIKPVEEAEDPEPEAPVANRAKNSAKTSYKSSELKTWKNSQLIDFMVEHNISKSGATKKIEYISRIISWQNVQTADYKELVEDLTTVTTCPPTHHQFYKDHFNSIDMLDKEYYSLQYHHKLCEWEPRYIISCLQTGIVNCSTFASAFENMSALTFFQKISYVLIDKDVKLKDLC